MASNIINQLYKHLKILSSDLDDTTNTIDNGPIVVTINSIQKSLSLLEDYYNREMDMEKRSTLKTHIKQIQNEFATLKGKYNKIREKERLGAKEQLLSQRIVGVANSTNINGINNGHFQSSHVIPPISAASSESCPPSPSSSLLMSNFRMEGILDIGSSVLDQLKNQRSMIKGTRRKLLDVTNLGIGMSNSYIRAIRRRFVQDRMIFWIGVIVTMIIVYLLWRYINSK